MRNKNEMTRRDFLNRMAAGTVAMSVTPLTSLAANQPAAYKWPKDAARYQFYMIGHGHIDPVWLWPWHEGVSVTLSTFRSALDRMNETPGLVFTASSAQLYQWVADNDPAMLEEIRRRIREGRWNVVGGWWIEPDANIPSGEAMARQGLYGQLTFERLLGVRARVAFHPDSFGHAGTLPQIFKLQGMENYTFMRPEPHEKKLPSNLFWWESPDGSRVLTYRIPKGYNEEKTVNKRIGQIMDERDTQPMKSYMSFFGVGDHGGGPTKETIRSIELLKKEKGAPTIFYSSTDRYFDDMRADKTLDLPVVKDDLQFHAVGCYTIEASIKKNNRQAEAALVHAEKLTSIGSFVWGVKYPKEQFTEAWHKVLFLQFHDSLAGSSLFEHSQTAEEGYGYAMSAANEARYLAAQRLEWQIPSEDPASKYIVVFNPHAWEVNQYLAYELGFFGENPKTSEVEDENGNSLPHQWVFGSSETGNRRMLSVQTRIPPMGYRQLRIKTGMPADIPHPVNISGNSIENQFLKVRFSPDGALGITDKESGREVFIGENGCRAVIMDDPSDTWSHAVVSYTDEIGAFGKAAFKVIDNGPLRATIRVTSHYGDSTLNMDWTLYAGSDELEANVTLDWHERRKMLKFSFPVDLEAAEANYETPYGFITRKTNGDEVPGQRWFDLSGKKDGAPYGFTVINDAKYGYDINGNDMHLSVIRSAVYAHHNPKKLDPEKEYIWMDQGRHTFRMKLIPHRGTWIDANIPRIAEEFLAPSTVVYQGIHNGSMPKSGSFMSVDAGNIVISSLKLAENNDDLIVRCVETHGTPATATINLQLVNKKWTGSFRPCEIKTLRVSRETGEIIEVNLLEE